MTAALLTQADYETVRKAIDSSLSISDLPDETIALPIYEAAAIRDVLDRDPTAASRTGNELRRVRDAAIFFCAARLAIPITGKMVINLSVQNRDLSWSRPAYDGAKRKADLLALAEAELAEVLTPSDETAEMPTMFTVASGRRGR